MLFFIFCLYFFLPANSYVIWSAFNETTFVAPDPTQFFIYDYKWNQINIADIELINKCSSLSLFGGKTSSGQYVLGKNSISEFSLINLRNDYPTWRMVLKMQVYIFGSTTTSGIVFKVYVNYTNSLGNNLKTSAQFIWQGQISDSSLYCESNMVIYNAETVIFLDKGISIGGLTNFTVIAPQYDDKNYGIRNFELTYSFCSPYCLTCEKLYYCLTCETPSKFMNKKCICPVGYYFPDCNLENNELCRQKCVKCSDHCDECDSNGCLTCEDGYFLKPDLTCTDTCPTGLVQDDIYCRCQSPCATCKFVTTNCLSCIEGKIFFNGVCQDGCPDGYYFDSGSCKLCDSSCKTCNGSSKTDCTSCDYTKFVLLEGTCEKDKCDPNYYNEAGVCKICDTSCATCSGPSEYECKSCDISIFVLLNGQCNYTECPMGYLNVSGVCVSCDGSCKTCKGTSNTDCTSCSNSDYVLINGACFTNNCPSNYYLENGECKICDVSCSTCKGPSNLECTSCDVLKHVLLNSSCVDGPCPLNYYQNNGKCIPCDVTCASCDGPSNADCLACSKDSVLLDGTCLNICPEHYYNDTGICKVCDTSCRTCKNQNKDGCLSCFTPSLLYAGYCIEECPSNTYQEFNTCKDCDILCDGCIGPGPSNCKLCKAGTFLDVDSCVKACSPPKFQDYNSRKCLSPCSEGFFMVPISETCDACLSPCKDCENKSNICIGCENPKYLYSHECIDNCPNGTYGDLYKRACRPCNEFCKTCRGPLFSDCLECQSGLYFDGFVCLESCSDETYQNEELKKCIICDSSCKTCFGENDNECIECKNGLFFDNGRCLEKCPDEKFSNPEKNNICEICTKNCKKCLSLFECETCYENFYLNDERKCESNKSLSYIVREKNNPNSFDLEFSDNWKYLKTNIHKIIVLEVESKEKIQIDSFSIKNSTTNEKTFNLNVKYKQRFSANQSKLIINIIIDYSKTDHQYYLIDSKKTIILKENHLTSNDEFFDKDRNQIVKKPNFWPVLIYTNNPLEISLKLSLSSSRLSANISQFSKISIEGMKESDYSYSLNKTSSPTDYIIVIKTNKSITSGPKLKYYFSISQELMQEENFLIRSNYSEIVLRDYIIMDPQQKKLAESIEDQNQQTSRIILILTSISFYLGYGNPLLLQGMMFVEMIQLIKFIEINYPQFVIDMFKNSQQIPKMFFFYEFQDSDDYKEILPAIYSFYDVSPYFIENTGEHIARVLTGLLLCYVLILFVENTTKKSFLIKLLAIIHSILVWQLMLFIMLISWQKFVFFTFSSFVFTSSNQNGTINLIVSSFFLIFSGLFLLHIFAILKILNIIKQRAARMHIFDAKSHKIFVEETNVHSLNDIRSQRGNNDDSSPDSRSPQKLINFNFDKSALSCESIKNEVSDKISKTASSNTSLASPVLTSNRALPIKTFKKNAVLPTIEESQYKPTMKKQENKKRLAACLHFMMEWISNLRVIQYMYHPKNDEVFLRQYDFFHVNLKIDHSYQIFYPLIDYCRLTSFSIIIAIHFNPFTQIFLINLVNIGFIIYFLLSMPYKSKIMFVCCLISEVLAQAALISALGLGILDMNEDKSEQTRLFFGWIIVVANLVLLYWLCVLSIAKIIAIFYERRKRMKIKNVG